MKIEQILRSLGATGLAFALSVDGWAAAPGQSQSHVGYVYPAGAQRGAELEITAGGMGLRNVQEVFISGEGVKATVVHTIPNFKKTYGDYLRFLIKQAKAKEQETLKKAAKKKGGSKKKTAQKTKKVKKVRNVKKAKKTVPADEMKPPPDHPIFRGLESMTFQELNVLLKRYYKENKQKNKQLDELVLMKMVVASDAPIGMREMRLRTKNGLTAPVRFFIGEKPEVYELEPNEKVPTNNELYPPFVLNGQIMPGDIDLFQFTAKEGQQLLIQAHARALIPYLADAVPGWFQATLTLLDSEGNELSYSDAYRFSQDPVLFYKIPDDGVYTIQIRDSVYRGREDFVYRISVGEDPYITSIFPMGGRSKKPLKVDVVGWNLSAKKVKVALDMNHDPGTVHFLQTSHLSNRIPYAVDEFPEVTEVFGNHTQQTAQKIKLPVIVNGRIQRAGEEDIYRFRGRFGERLVIDVNARRLHSPLDSHVRLTDAKGKVIASNDDFKRLNLGMQTHHADSRVQVKLPAEGEYFLAIGDTQGKGGDEFEYRLRISRPHPDFSLTSTPASITVKRGCSVPITVYALRKDGFNGEIKIDLKDAPKGFKLGGATIPSGQDHVTMTLTAPLDARNEWFQIRLRGSCKIDRGVVNRDVLPGTAMTQAFITHHVLPAQKMMVYVGSGGEIAEAELSKNAQVKIPWKGETSLRIKRTNSKAMLSFKLYQAPVGVTLEPKKSTNNAIPVVLKAGSKAQQGNAGNLLIEVIRTSKNKKGKTYKTSLGVMPAIPFVIE